MVEVLPRLFISVLSQSQLAFEAVLSTDVVRSEWRGWLSLSFSGKQIGPSKADGSLRGTSKKSAGKLWWRLSNKQQLTGEENQSSLAMSCHDPFSFNAHFR